MSQVKAPETKGKLWMGPGTLEIPIELFALNRSRLVQRLRTKHHGNEHFGNPVILLQGGDEVPFYDTDTTYNVFRQESYFMWAFGVLEPGCFGAIDLRTGKSVLFIPHYPDSYAVWMGPLLCCADFVKKYKVDEAYFVEEMPEVLRKFNASLLTLSGINSDSGLSAKEASFNGIEEFNVNNKLLYPEISELRVFKTDMEIEVMQYVAEVSSAAHRKVLRYAQPGRSEYQCESLFLHHCYSIGGCRHVSYTCICASHVNSAVLHYGHAGAPNNRFMNEGDLCLFDMGANYFGYAADITCTFPINGRFNPNQKIIYEAVLEANLAVLKEAKPGERWFNMHLLANKILLQELKKAGLVKGDVDKMVNAGLGSVFQPHGLGHLLGLDVHDVGGYLEDLPRRPTLRGANKLRTARILDVGMVLTVEPGCYFIDNLIDEAMEDPTLCDFLVPEVIDRFRRMGGVRIEDDILITAGGNLNLTKVPRTVKEIEDWMAGKGDRIY